MTFTILLDGIRFLSVGSKCFKSQIIKLLRESHWRHRKVRKLFWSRDFHFLTFITWCVFMLFWPFSVITRWTYVIPKLQMVINLSSWGVDRLHRLLATAAAAALVSSLFGFLSLSLKQGSQRVSSARVSCCARKHINTDFHFRPTSILTCCVSSASTKGVLSQSILEDITIYQSHYCFKLCNISVTVMLINVFVMSFYVYRNLRTYLPFHNDLVFTIVDGFPVPLFRMVSTRTCYRSNELSARLCLNCR